MDPALAALDFAKAGAFPPTWLCPISLLAPRRPIRRGPVSMIPKIAERHLSRLACIYIRQSTLAQVRFNQESTDANTTW